jgi:hypothetical protein
VPELDADPAWRLAAAFLLGYRRHGRAAIGVIVPDRRVIHQYWEL